MSDAPQLFDFKITPDWLKDTSTKNPYADFGGDERSREDRRGGKPPRGKGPRPGGPGRPDRRDSRDKRAPGDDRRSGPPRGDRRSRPGGGRLPDERPRRNEAPAARPEPQAAPVVVEFLPDPVFADALARQLKSAGHAYPLLEIARMLMARPEHQRVRLHVSKEGVELFQCGENGPVALDRALLLADGFEAQLGKLYAKENIQKEEIRGNFTNVARCRRTGVLLGPTNHHTYQGALRKLYEERFSRRMGYEEFLRDIEVVTDLEIVAQWKEQARSVTVFKTLGDEEPRAFESEAEAVRDFRERHFDKLVTAAKAFEISGTTSRALADRSLFYAIRNAWEKQSLFPAQMIFHVRRQCVANGLHVFRRGKNMQFVSAHRPRRFKGDPALLAEGVANILRVVGGKPSCTRHDLAAQLLPRDPAHPDLARIKEQLASDLHWLIQSAHIVEYHDGRLELAPDAPEQKPEKKTAPQAGNPPQAAQKTSVEIAPDAPEQKPEEKTAPQAANPPAAAQETSVEIAPDAEI